MPIVGSNVEPADVGRSAAAHTAWGPRRDSFRDAAESLRAASFEYEAAEDAALQLQAKVAPEWWEGSCEPTEPMEISYRGGKASHSNGGGGGGGDGGGGRSAPTDASADGVPAEGKARTSQYRGVSRRYGRWKARIKQNGTDIVIGDFDNEIEAALAYDKKARQLHGPKAFVNFPDGPPAS
jgi:hypothetical protein